MTDRKLSSLIATGVLAVIILSGCGSMRTRKEFYEPITAELRAGRYDVAAAALESAQAGGKYDHKDRFVYFLDAGLAYHYAHAVDLSNQRLQQAEIAAEELFTKSISRAMASMLLNDNVLAYAGEDHEVLYANLIGALNYISVDDFDDAFVEIRRANLKLEQLEQKYADVALRFERAMRKDSSLSKIEYSAEPVRFYNSAFARYMSMHLYAAEGRLDEARIDYDYLREAFELQPEIYNFPLPEVNYDRIDGAVLSVVALAGLSPVKEALNLRIRTDKDLGLVQVLYTDPQRQNSEYGHLPIRVTEDYYFKFALPQFVDRQSRISHVQVYAGGELLGRLQLLEDVGMVARETFQSKKNWIYIRSVIRAVAKGLQAHKQKQKADTGGLKGWLSKAAIDLMTDLTENADLRCARLLPDRIMVADFVIAPGNYDLTVEFIDYNGGVIDSHHIADYKVLAHGLNMIEAVCLK